MEVKQKTPINSLSDHIRIQQLVIKRKLSYSYDILVLII